MDLIHKERLMKHEELIRVPNHPIDDECLAIPFLVYILFHNRYRKCHTIPQDSDI